MFNTPANQKNDGISICETSIVNDKVQVNRADVLLSTIVNDTWSKSQKYSRIDSIQDNIYSSISITHQSHQQASSTKKLTCEIRQVNVYKYKIIQFKRHGLY